MSQTEGPQTESQWELPVLSDAQKNHLVNARACGLSFDEITSTFREVYPDYAPNIPDDVFEKYFRSRVKQYLNSSQSKGKYLLEAKQRGEIPVDVGAVPLVLPHVRLGCYQRLWEETQTRTLVRAVKTENSEILVYKDNTRDRIAILDSFRKEIQLLGIVPTYHSLSERKPLSDDELVKILEEDGDNKTLEDIWDEGDSDADTEQT